jgi:hypothetical protein
MFKQVETRNKKFEENPVLKLEQRLENRTENRGRSLVSAQLLVHFSHDWFSERLANSVNFLSILFISLDYFHIIFNNTCS